MKPVIRKKEDRVPPGSTFCGAREVPTGEGDVGERVATLEQSFASESMMHHYNLSTRHVFQTRRSDIRSETLAASRSTIEVATRGHAVPLPGFPEYFLSIRKHLARRSGLAHPGTRAPGHGSVRDSLDD